MAVASVIGGGGPAVLALLDAREAYAFAREDWALEHPKVKAACAAVEAAQEQLPGPPIQWPPVADQLEGCDVYGNRLWERLCPPDDD